MTITEWLASTFGTSVIIGGLIVAFKDIILGHVAESIKHRYAKDLQSHINDLHHQSELALKDFEAKFSERDIKLSEVFKKQADIIVETYKKLLSVLDAAEDYTRLLQEGDKQKQLDQIHIFNQKCKDFFDFYVPNKIYIPRQTYTQLNTLLRVVGRIVGYQYRADTLSRAHPLTQSGQEALQRMENQIDEFKDKVPDLLLKLEDDFQRILGVRIEEKK